MKKLDYVNYDNCISNLTSSIQKHYNIKPNYKTNELIDNLLKEKDYDNVIIFVFDGMGNAIIDKNTTANHYLQKHRISKMDSTFPPTTANCTTTFLSGLNPIETGWLGWATYYKDLDLVIDNFPNCDTVSKQVIEGDNIANRKLPYKPLGESIEESSNGEVKYYSIWPSFAKNGCKSLKEFENRICKICRQEGKKYIYAYWDQPDGFMHNEGTSTNHIKKVLNDIGKTLHKIERKTNNTIGIVSADHGQIDVTPIALYTYYDLLDCLSAPFSCDPRCAFFFVKDERKNEFVELFNKYFKDYYDLFTKEEVIFSNLFGYGKKNNLLDDIVGDYVAIAKDHYYFMQSTISHNFKGHHAGGLDDEKSIPIIVFKN